VIFLRGLTPADVTIINSFGAYDLAHFGVWAAGLPDGIGKQELPASLKTRPKNRRWCFWRKPEYRLRLNANRVAINLKQMLLLLALIGFQFA
jgi:hypothetical protein